MTPDACRWAVFIARDDQWRFVFRQDRFISWLYYGRPRTAWRALRCLCCLVSTSVCDHSIRTIAETHHKGLAARTWTL